MFEELLHQFHALGREHAFHDLHTMIQQFGIGQVKFAAHAAETQIARSKHQPLNSRGNQRAGAHHARFQRSVQRGGFQTVVAQTGAGVAKREDFGVRLAGE